MIFISLVHLVLECGRAGSAEEMKKIPVGDGSERTDSSRDFF